ncbi:hypothetical protein Taro_013545 [Colocasia esculenta]|uniref:Uncharacterized protein n=1 Tax=Colocasia esculenta TaxID=4460 RepID=A0A843UCC1_COLES|nr:hypothetical protein [Colocasia esculenta]
MYNIQKSVQRPKQKHRYKKKGAYPEDLQSTTLSSLGYKSSQRSLSLLLTTHGATAASATRLTLSSHDDEPLAEGSRGSSRNSEK